MKTWRSWRRVAWIVLAFAIFIVGRLWRPVALLARPVAAVDSALSHSHAAPFFDGEQSGQPGQTAQEAGAKKSTAGDAYMNIQVLKDIPSDQLLPSMRYITAVLGVECNFCHDPKSYENDDKPEKATARKMMAMMFAINKDNFNGRREVTCYTCHHGASHPANMPTAMAVVSASGEGGAMPAAQHGPPDQHQAAAGAAPSAAAPSAASGPVPTVDDVIAKYTQALGGSDALQKVTTLTEKGTMDIPAHNMHGAEMEVWRKAPDKALAVLHVQNGEVSEGYNGTAGWQQRPGRGTDDIAGDELVRTKQWASFIPGLDLKQNFSRAQVAGVDKIDGHDAYRVIAFRNGGGQVRFFFDKDSGLLLRISERIESALGALPEDMDFADYRDVGGMKRAFSITVAHADGPTIYKWDQIQANTPVDDGRFNKPAPKEGQ